MAEDITNDKEIKHSTREMVSFQCSYFSIQILGLIFSSRLVSFYEVEVGLSIWLYTLGYSIYTAWDAFNDPFMGYLSDRPNRLWKRYGKRFPWIIIASILSCIAFILIFIPPDPKENQWATFFWFLFVIFLYDGLMSIVLINRNALLPDKFRIGQERKKLAGIFVPFMTGGLILGMMLPPLLITYGDKNSYIFMSIIACLIALIIFVLSIPGMKEDEIMNERAFKAAQKERTSFIGTLKQGWKQKNFRVFILRYIPNTAANALFIASTPYFVRYVLKGEAIVEIYLYAAYLIPGVLLVPLWIKLGKKVTYVKLYPILYFLVGIVFLVSIFIVDLIMAVIVVLFLGAFYGGLNALGPPIDAEMFDEAAVLNGERNEGTFYGLQTVIGKVGQVLYIIILAVIHTVTNFDPELGLEQSDLAVLGIRLQFGLATAIFVFLCAFIFWKWWDLTPEKHEEILKKMEEMDL